MDGEEIGAAAREKQLIRERARTMPSKRETSAEVVSQVSYAHNNDSKVEGRRTTGWGGAAQTALAQMKVKIPDAAMASGPSDT